MRTLRKRFIKRVRSSATKDGTDGQLVQARNSEGRQDRRNRLWRQWAVQKGICADCPAKVPLLDARFRDPKKLDEPNPMVCKNCQYKALSRPRMTVENEDAV